MRCLNEKKSFAPSGRLSFQLEHLVFMVKQPCAVLEVLTVRRGCLKGGSANLSSVSLMSPFTKTGVSLRLLIVAVSIFSRRRKFALITVFGDP